MKRIDYSVTRKRRTLPTGQTVTAFPRKLGKGAPCKRCGKRVRPGAATDIIPGPPMVGMVTNERKR
jgi:ribosomal protein L34E